MLTKHLIYCNLIFPHAEPHVVWLHWIHSAGGEAMIMKLLSIGGFPFVMWQTGAFNTYPELTTGLFLIYLAVLAPNFETPEWRIRWKQLHKYRKKAEKFHDDLLVGDIDAALSRLDEWNTPLTIGALKDVLRQMEGRLPDVDRTISLWAIRDRLDELKKQRRLKRWG